MPTRLASEDVIINAPMSYAGSGQRIWRLRRQTQSDRALIVLTALAIALVVMAWTLVTAWYLLWGLWLVPYRLLRRGARKRKAEALRHREMMGVIQGSAAASSAAIVTATTGQLAATQAAILVSPEERVSDADRERAIEDLGQHMLAGRLTAAEFETGVASLHRAVTRADVAGVMTGLPAIPPVG